MAAIPLFFSRLQFPTSMAPRLQETDALQVGPPASVAVVRGAQLDLNIHCLLRGTGEFHCDLRARCDRDFLVQ